MKKFFVGMLILAAAFTAVPAYAEDSILDKAGDWIATVGKSPAEEDRILLERKTERVAKEFQKGAKKMGKDLEGAFN
jgi:hypothetical protein